MFNWIVFLLYFSDAFYIYAVISLISVFLYAQIDVFHIHSKPNYCLTGNRKCEHQTECDIGT